MRKRTMKKKITCNNKNQLPLDKNVNSTSVDKNVDSTNIDVPNGNN